MTCITANHWKESRSLHGATRLLRLIGFTSEMLRYDATTVGLLYGVYPPEHMRTYSLSWHLPGPLARWRACVLAASYAGIDHCIILSLV